MAVCLFLFILVSSGEAKLQNLLGGFIFAAFQSLLPIARYLVWRPRAKTLPVFFFLNSTLITASAFPTRKVLASISISSCNKIGRKYSYTILRSKQNPSRATRKLSNGLQTKSRNKIVQQTLGNLVRPWDR